MTSQASATAPTRPATLSRTASARNCAARPPRAAPSTLRTPASRARSTERAVARLTKFTAATSSTNSATSDSTCSVFGLPWTPMPRSVPRYTSASGRARNASSSARSPTAALLKAGSAARNASTRTPSRSRTYVEKPAPNQCAYQPRSSGVLSDTRASNGRWDCRGTSAITAVTVRSRSLHPTACPTAGPSPKSVAARRAESTRSPGAASAVAASPSSRESENTSNTCGSAKRTWSALYASPPTRRTGSARERRAAASTCGIDASSAGASSPCAMPTQVVPSSPTKPASMRTMRSRCSW